ncbi:hypothetical protein KU617_23115, partial [Salmonella enterica subsp. enterica serovar Montevideo]|nr:hypothetical protein [Salmonella enterica subsp. enterica serovar Montevideo]
LALEKQLYDELFDLLLPHLADLQQSANALAELDVLVNLAERAALRYRERQQLPGQAETVRWSTVILKRERGRIVWRHLHETTV